jgi:hypothetical protein
MQNIDHAGESVKTKYNDHLKSYLKELNEDHESITYKKVFQVEGGRKFDKITYRCYGQTSVFCFIDKATGDILKSASWRAPAKGARGSIFSDKRPTKLGQLYIVR